MSSKLILFLILFMPLADALQVYTDFEWRSGMKQLVTVDSELEGLSVDMSIVDAQGNVISKADNITKDNGHYAHTFIVPANLEGQTLDINIRTYNMQDSVNTTKKIQVLKQNIVQRWLNIIFGNLFGVHWF